MVRPKAALWFLLPWFLLPLTRPVNVGSVERPLQEDLAIDAVGAPKFKYQIKKPQIKSYENSTIALDDLRLGDGVRLDGVVSSLPVFLEAIENGYPIKVLGQPIFYEPLSVTIDLGDAALNDSLKEIVTNMREDGTLTKISKKWYGVDYATTQ